MSESVYFVRCTGTGRIKIGRSTDVERRVAALNSGPAPVELLATVPKVGPAGERFCHMAFSRIRVHMEWFDPHPALLRAIAYIAEAATSRVQTNREVLANAAFPAIPDLADDPEHTQVLLNIWLGRRDAGEYMRDLKIASAARVRGETMTREEMDAAHMVADLEGVSVYEVIESYAVKDIVERMEYVQQAA